MSSGGYGLRCAQPPLHLPIELAEIILGMVEAMGAKPQCNGSPVLHLPSLPKPAARGYETSRLLNGIAAKAHVTTDLYVTSDPCFSTGFLIEHQYRPRAVAAAGTGCTIVYRNPFLWFLLG
jgi:hypothetical protein